MNHDFPKIISFLRKEKGVSQKSVASELKISQALLSHYEKGIRECGLDFLIAISKYYNVSCDYILGITKEKNNNIYDEEKLSNELEKDIFKSSENILIILNKKIIINSINIIFDMLKKVNNKNFVDEISNFLIISIYRVFRIIYSINPHNKEIFGIKKSIYNRKSLARMELAEANIITIIENEAIFKDDVVNEIEKKNFEQDMFTGDQISNYSYLLNLIQKSESEINMK
ncbi:MAG: helix-turn-helix transcriptional regulator [Oscillospiraceae bacterium]|nr:helix-turn-helix transcriptional regulator [Oscillospiraceae bacterium]